MDDHGGVAEGGFDFTDFDAVAADLDLSVGAAGEADLVAVLPVLGATLAFTAARSRVDYYLLLITPFLVVAVVRQLAVLVPVPSRRLAVTAAAMLASGLVVVGLSLKSQVRH